MNLMHDTISAEHRFCNKTAVLQIHKILLILTVVGKLRIGRQCKGTRFITRIGYFQSPYFIFRTNRDVIIRFRMNSGIVRQNLCIPLSMTHFIPIGFQVFPDRLPGCGPVIPGFIIP